jgi:hypothetical protein
MKTLLLLFVGLSCIALTAKSQITGACDIISITTEYKSSSPSVMYPGKCDVKVNISWEQDANNGNKFTYFHIWQAGSYQPFAYSNPSNPPMAGNLSATLGTIVVANPSSDNPYLVTNYNPDATYTKVLPLSGFVPLVLSKTTVNNIDRFTVENVVLAGVTCNINDVYQFVADAWSSQQNQGKNVHCAGKGNPFSINEVVDRSSLNCASNSLQVQVLSSTPTVQGTYQVFADLNTFGSFNPSTDVAVTPTQNFTTSNTTLVGGVWRYKFLSSLITVPVAYKKSNFWVRIIPNGGKAIQVFIVSNSCATLPVALSGFSATRNKNIVNLKWQTLSEQNSAGFNIQRNTGGAWVTIGFLPSKSAGNSSATLSYDFADANSFKGVTQYQLAEVSKDGKVRLSEVKAVKGENQPNKVTLYPNPSNDGKVTLVFESTAARDIAIYEMTGRMVKQLTGVTNNNVVIENLQPGFYSVKVLDRATNEVAIEKLVITKI